MAQPTTAYIPGKALSATIGGTAATVQKSSMKVSVDSLKATNARSNGYQEVIAGIKAFSGTLTCVVDANAPITVNEGDYIDVVVGVKGGRSISGSAMVTELGDDADITGDYELTVTVESNGQYTLGTGA